jgi:hypothetical protein
MQSFLRPRTLAAAALLGVLAVPAAANAQDPTAPERPRRNPGVPGAVPVTPPADLPAEPFTVSAATTVLT